MHLVGSAVFRRRTLNPNLSAHVLFLCCFLAFAPWLLVSTAAKLHRVSLVQLLLLLLSLGISLATIRAAFPEYIILLVALLGGLAVALSTPPRVATEPKSSK